MLVLGRSQVEALLDVDILIDVLAVAMADLSAGRASAPDRVAALVPGVAATLPPVTAMRAADAQCRDTAADPPGADRGV
ncbi:hypothetical protein [Streptomyces cinerochromogenes]|uniref:hypothetical protein n=1 Tax=Streptomyces cinerochromogenes TaxID=66422 RepID=UPI001985379D|nr:hypothetical protein [Streptomyces cinerochromogenes]GGS62624.1 hypothetical protein GCM10010206_26260 [Streptomyces cinerochromogenes]